MVAMTRTKLIGARDPNGIRPLVLGDLDGNPIFASETCALDIIGAKFVRDVENGEVVIAETAGRRPHHHRIDQAVRAAAGSACASSNTSTSPRPDSVVGGRLGLFGAQAHGHQSGA